MNIKYYTNCSQIISVSIEAQFYQLTIAIDKIKIETHKNCIYK